MTNKTATIIDFSSAANATSREYRYALSQHMRNLLWELCKDMHAIALLSPPEMRNPPFDKSSLDRLWEYANKDNPTKTVLFKDLKGILKMARTHYVTVFKAAIENDQRIWADTTPLPSSIDESAIKLAKAESSLDILDILIDEVDLRIAKHPQKGILCRYTPHP